MIKRSICATKSMPPLLALMMPGLTACTTQEQPAVHDYGVVTSGDFEFMKNGVTTYPPVAPAIRTGIPAKIR